MKNLFLGALVLLLGATSCADDERNEPQQPEEKFRNPGSESKNHRTGRRGSSIHWNS